MSIGILFILVFVAIGLSLRGLWLLRLIYRDSEAIEQQMEESAKYGRYH